MISTRSTASGFLWDMKKRFNAINLLVNDPDLCGIWQTVIAG